jgi:hypothetical protein
MMKAEPPTGDEFTALLVTVKGRVMKAASGTRQKRRRLGLAGLLISGAAILVIGGAGTAVATGYVTGVFHTIPHSTNRPADPPPPTDYDQATNNQLEPDEASLGQLWALANSEVGDAADASRTPGPGVGLADFSAAITNRCYPMLSDSETAELDRLKAGYESLSGAEALEPARAYFVRATELCM